MFRPILGSPEQFVIGIGLANESEIHLERANQLSRLKCVFMDAAEFAIVAAESALDAIEADLKVRHTAALTDFQPIFSGVLVGEIKHAEGKDLKQIGASWMSSISSVYSRHPEIEINNVISSTDIEDIELDSGDRLPKLVMEYVRVARPGIGDFFSSEIRENRRRRKDAHSIAIDFSGSRLVANFATLAISNFTSSVKTIKTRLWELKVDRDRENESFVKREHEMIVQHPSYNDPQLTEKQVHRMETALIELRKQADQEELNLLPLNRIEEIGDHILLKEAA